jgi:2-keto-4-pentenoate hydratase
VTDADRESAAQFLVAARDRGIPGARIPARCRPDDLDNALAIQARVTSLLGEPIGGYKCALPSELRPMLLAPIFAAGIKPHTSPYPVRAVGATVRIEPEIALVMARDLPRPAAAAYTDSEIRGAIKEVRLVLEILGSRYSEPNSATFPELLADGLMNQGVLVGPAVHDPWNAELGSLDIVIDSPSGVLVAHQGKHPDGHPVLPLYWLANYLASSGTPLRAGAIVTTGSYCGAVDVPLDTPFTVAYGDLGTLSATLARA